MKLSKIRIEECFNIPLFIILLLLLPKLLVGESHKKSYNKIIEAKGIILSASKLFNINPKYLSAIIYTERTNNFDWTDEVFDEVIARVGQNSSIGFSQVKLKTAYFIERQFADSTMEFYCGSKYQNILEVSENPYQIIEKLKNDSTNILYAAAYLKLIQTFWFRKGYSIDDKPEIIGSLYQLGLFFPNGKLREPHFNPKANEFGEKVKESLKHFELFDNKDPIMLFN